MSNLALILLTLPMVGSLEAFVFGKIDKRLAFWIAELVGLSLFLITINYIWTTLSL